MRRHTLSIRWMRALLFAAATWCLLAPPALAGTITWQYYGTVTQTYGLPDFSVGMPYTLLWTFNPDQPNSCEGVPGGNPRTGWYQGQTVQWSINGLDYIGTGLLLVNTTADVACWAVTPVHDLELQLFNWSGPPLPISGLSVAPMFQLGHGLFNTSWYTGQGEFPTSPPPNMGFVGPRFEDWNSVQGTAIYTPEPSSLILLGSGLALWRLRSSRKQGAE